MDGKRIKQNTFVFLAVVMVFFVGCFPMFPISRQSRIGEKDINKIEVGSSTKTEVYDLLGKPNFLESTRYCVYEVGKWHGGFVLLGNTGATAFNFGSDIYRLLLEFNENNTLISYVVEKGVIAERPHNYHYIHPKVAFSPNGKTLAVLRPYDEFVGFDYEVLLIDLETKERVEFGKEDLKFIKPEFSPDSRYLVLTGHHTKVIDISNPSKAYLFKGHGEHSNWSWNPKSVTSLAFFPDGKKVATGGSRGFLKIWELSTGTEIKSIKAHNGEVDSIKISPDGKFIVSGGSRGFVKIWELSTGTETKSIKAHNGEVDSIEISPDGKFIATGSGGNIRIWDSTTGNELDQMTSKTDRIGGMNKQCSFKFSPDGKLFAVNRGTHVELWNIYQERVFKELANVFLLPVFDETSLGSIQPSLDFSKDGHILAASFGSIVVYNIDNKQRIWTYNFESLPNRFKGVSYPDKILVKYGALHPNGKFLFIYTDDGVSQVDLKQER